MTALLDVAGLSHSFGGIRVARDISLTLEPGARVALIGPNGAGKTTFVNLVTGQIRPQSGQVALAGVDVTRRSPEARVRCGLVRSFQISRLFRDMSVIEHMMLSVLARNGHVGQIFKSMGGFPAEMREACDNLERIGLSPLANARVGNLAYGQQRLLEIGLALSLKPKVLLLDEPAAGVAQTETPRILALLAALPPDLAVLMIDHDLDLVFRFAQRIVVLAAGEVIAEGDATSIMADERVREAYLGGYGRGRRAA